MKKLFTLSFLFLFFVGTAIANDLIIRGTMTNSGGDPVPDIEVKIDIKLSNIILESWTVITDEQGEFEVTNTRDPNLRLVVVEVSYKDCLGSLIKKQQLVFDNQQLVTFDLQYCPRDSNTGCSVSILTNRSPFGFYVYIAAARGTVLITYEWSNGSTDQRTIGLPNQNLCVTITDSNGCTASACINEPSGDCDVSIGVNETNAGTVLIANPSSSDVLSYEWTTGQTTRLIRITKGGTYCVKVTFANGCVATACVTIEDDDDDDTEPCINAKLLQIVNSDTTATLRVVMMQNIPVEFEWNTGDTTSFITISESSTYSVTITDTRFEDCELVLTITVILDENGCRVALTAVEHEDGYTLTIIGASPNQQIDKVLWNTGDTTVMIEVPLDSATYCADVQVGLCRTTLCIDLPIKEDEEDDDDDDNFSIDLLALQNDPPHKTISLFPNPASSFIQLQNVGSENMQVILLDGTGRVMQVLLRDKIPEGATVEIDISSYASGIYFIQIKQGDQMETLRFVKQ